MITLSTTGVLDSPRLEERQRSRIALAGKVLGIGGVVLIAAGAVGDPKRFGFSYLVGFTFVVTLALGALFFVVLQHLTRAGWSVGPRRQMEWLASGLPLAALLFVPVALLAPNIFHHWMGHEAAADAIVAKKAGYLNAPFFFIRAGLYFAVWMGMARFFCGASRDQDSSGDRELTLRMQRYSAPAMVAFALTITFAAFDWLMSLDPHWFSTIFGVYVFSGSVTSSLAALALLTIGLQATGALKRVSTVEHRADIGKLLFAFTVFWAYIAFSQYFLIWYANIPEETLWFIERWEHGWRPVSVALMVTQFAVPFGLLLSRAGKRSAWVLGAASIVLLIGHAIDLYWLVLPTADQHPHFELVDLAGLLGPIGVFGWWVARRMAADRIYPVGDPRLHEALKFEAT